MQDQSSAVESLYATAKWYLDDGRLTQATDLFRVLLLAAATDERGWLGIGACHDLLGQPGVALELYTLGALASKSARCHVARARALRALSRDDEAVAAIEEAECLLDDSDDQDVRLLVLDERRAS